MKHPFLNQTSDEWISQTNLSKKPNQTNESEERRLKIILCAPTQKQQERRVQVTMHVVPMHLCSHRRYYILHICFPLPGGRGAFQNMRSALMPPLMQTLRSSSSKHVLGRDPTYVDSVKCR